MNHIEASSERNDITAVRAALQAFQDGYSRRDARTVDEFMTLFMPDDQLEVVGTSAVDPSGGEWCIGQSATRALIEADWNEWGDLALDVDAARIHVNGDAAWLSTTGTVSQKLPLEHAYAGMATFLQGFVERRAESGAADDAAIEGELLTVILGAASALSERRQGEHHVWPIRFTAVLARQDAAWKFHQIHFSYPTVHLPQVRLR
jgi:ketosteroid isomerase-like protein